MYDSVKSNIYNLFLIKEWSLNLNIWSEEDVRMFFYLFLAENANSWLSGWGIMEQ